MVVVRVTVLAMVAAAGPFVVVPVVKELEGVDAVVVVSECKSMKAFLGLGAVKRVIVLYTGSGLCRKNVRGVVVAKRGMTWISAAVRYARSPYVLAVDAREGEDSIPPTRATLLTMIQQLEAAGPGTYVGTSQRACAADLGYTGDASEVRKSRIRGDRLVVPLQNSLHFAADLRVNEVGFGRCRDDLHEWLLSDTDTLCYSLFAAAKAITFRPEKSKRIRRKALGRKGLFCAAFDAKRLVDRERGKAAMQGCRRRGRTLALFGATDLDLWTMMPAIVESEELVVAGWNMSQKVALWARVALGASATLEPWNSRELAEIQPNRVVASPSAKEEWRDALSFFGNLVDDEVAACSQPETTNLQRFVAKYYAASASFGDAPKRSDAGRMISDDETTTPWFSFDSGLGAAVHVITTRFCLTQGRVVELVMARLELLEAFCLPSIAAQTSRRFVWVVMVDSDLHPPARARLNALLRPYPHMHVVSVSDWSRVTSVADQLALAKVWRKPPKSAASVRLLQTRIDADDALPSRAVDVIQHDALEIGRRHDWSINNVSKARERVIFWKTAADWGPKSDATLGTIWFETNDFPISVGLTKVTDIATSRFLKNEESPRSIRSVMKYVHTEIDKIIRCHRVLAPNDVVPDELFEKPSRNNKNPNNIIAAPLRTRTIASNSMRGVHSAKDKRRRRVVAQMHAVVGIYGLSETLVARINQRLVQSEKNIAIAHLAVRCRDKAHFSCTEFANARLTKLARKNKHHRQSSGGGGAN
ncbi:hypothetical protein CTAYLR_007799 [Chrysophaeum taylorii]|uniref:Uncharacterized protein n=1 Tax=Chrysophaeum taylorii TaxID=2483200 RepID=A0AAD7UKU7_9STRA|nr:hypothetical protein CTAYLR_007799 [Chrysophaeum taylorii]